MQNKQHPRFPTKFASSFFNRKHAPLPVLSFWPLIMLTDALKLTKEPTSIGWKAARAQITRDYSLNTGLFPQLSAFVLATRDSKKLGSTASLT
jgi:hypothetical protein